jgi:hypothetical protein
MVAVVKTIGNTPVMPPKDGNAAKRNRYLKVLDIGVLLGALIVFLVFLAILIRVVFPEGSRLGDMTSERNSEFFESDRLGQVDVDAGGIGSLGSFIAHLGDVRREVKIRSADSIAWSDASEGATVHNRDAVQTFSRSRARVDFTTNNELRIGQNSLVVFRSGAADPFLDRRDPAVVVMDGELSGTVNADYGALAVQFPAGLVELTAAGQSGAPVDFRVGVNPDKSSTISVISGQADVNIAGQHYRVSAKQGLTITEDGRTTGTRALPSLPQIRSPGNNAVAKYVAAPPRVTFRWDVVPVGQNYRVEIAEDPEFEEILVDEYLDEPQFVHGNLSSGDYFWRVRARDGWIHGPASTPRRLSVVRDAVPPVLNLRPIQDVADGRYVLRGATAPGSTVYVLGEPVEISSAGDFEFFFNPEPGSQSIVVESIDEVGNVTYSSQILHVPGDAGRSD